MCRDAVDREGRREWGGLGLGGLPWARRVPCGSLRPRRSAPLFASSPEARSPWAGALGLGIQSVTLVSGQNCHLGARLHKVRGSERVYRSAEISARHPLEAGLRTVGSYKCSS
jgi:hypothetical protein